MYKKCPDKIYLQVCDECYEETMKNAPDEITWCVDQMDHANELCNGDGHVTIYDEESDTFSDPPLDMAYIREDIYTDLLRHIKEAVESSRQYADGCLESGQDTSLVISERTNYLGKRSGILLVIDELRERVPELEE